MMHGREKSDSAIVAGKPTNKAVSTAAEPVERRAEAKGNASQQSTRRTQSRVSVSQALERIRQAVAKNAMPSHERPYRDLTNVVAKYPFESSLRFPGSSGDRLAARLSPFAEAPRPSASWLRNSSLPATCFGSALSALARHCESERPARSAALELGKQAHHLLAQE
jgi:hypothetical protein